MPGVAGFLPSTVWQILGSQKFASKFHPVTWKTVILLGTNIFWGPHFDLQPWGRFTRQSKSLGRSTPTHFAKFCESWGAKNARICTKHFVRSSYLILWDTSQKFMNRKGCLIFWEFFLKCIVVDVSIIAPLFYANMAPTTFRYCWKKQENNYTPENEHHVRKSSFFNRKYIFKWWIFHCRVSFRGVYSIYEHTNILGISATNLYIHVWYLKFFYCFCPQTSTSKTTGWNIFVTFQEETTHIGKSSVQHLHFVGDMGQFPGG